MNVRPLFRRLQTCTRAVLCGQEDQEGNLETSDIAGVSTAHFGGGPTLDSR